MNKYLFAFALVFLNFFFKSVISIPWSFFDPLLCLVVMFAFFHNHDRKHYLIFAFFCGLLGDLLSLDLFGLRIIGYGFISIFSAYTARVLYRYNWRFIFGVVFVCGVFLNIVFLFIKSFWFAVRVDVFWVRLFLKILTESLGTMLLAYPIYRISKKCGLDFSG